jgi:hypothetical protein
VDTAGDSEFFAFGELGDPPAVAPVEHLGVDEVADDFFGEVRVAFRLSADSVGECEFFSSL